MSLNSGFIDSVSDFLAREPRTAHLIVHRLRELEKPFLLRGELQVVLALVGDEEFSCDLAGTPIETMFHWAQEAIVDGAAIHFAVRSSVARGSYVRLQWDPWAVSEVSTVEFLAVKERLVTGHSHDDEWTLWQAEGQKMDRAIAQFIFPNVTHPWRR